MRCQQIHAVHKTAGTSSSTITKEKCVTNLQMKKLLVLDSICETAVHKTAVKVVISLMTDAIV